MELAAVIKSMKVGKSLIFALFIGLLCSCASDEDKAKSTVEKYFNALAQKDTKAASELYPNSSSQHYNFFVELKSYVYKNPEITCVKVKENKYEVDFNPASCFYVEKNDNGDFIITDSRNVVDVAKNELSIRYNIAIATGAIKSNSTDIQILKAEQQIRAESDFFNFLVKKYAKYYNGDFKILSQKKEQIGKAVFIKVTYQTSLNVSEHAVAVEVKGKDGKVVATKQKNVNWLDAGNINSVTIMFNGDMVDYITDYNVYVGLLQTDDLLSWLEKCGAPFSKSDYKEFLKSK